MPQHVHVLKRFEGMLELGFWATHVVGAMAYKIEPCEPHQILSMPPGETISVYRGYLYRGTRWGDKIVRVGLLNHKVPNKPLLDLTYIQEETTGTYLVCLPTSCMLSNALIPGGVSMIHCAQIIARAFAFMRFSSWCWDILRARSQIVTFLYSILYIPFNVTSK